MKLELFFCPFAHWWFVLWFLAFECHNSHNFDIRMCAIQTSLRCNLISFEAKEIVWLHIVIYNSFFHLELKKMVAETVFLPLIKGSFCQ